MTADHNSRTLNASRSKGRKRLTWLGIIIGLIFLAYELSVVTIDPRLLADDTVEYWAAGRLNLTGGNPYAADQLLPLERAAGRTTEVLMMWNPPYTLALAMPLALAPYPLARLLWLLLSILSVLIAADWLWQLYGGAANRRWLAQAIAFTFFATVTVLRMGQIGPVLLLGIAGFLRFERAGRDGLAGACLALLAIKPHLLYLIWLALLLWALPARSWTPRSWTPRPWRVPVGAALALIAATASALIANPHVIGQYLVATAADSPLVWATPNLGSLLRTIFGFQIHWLQFVPLAPGIIWLAFYWRRHATDWRWPDHMPLLLLVSVTTAAFGWSFDLVVLLPAILVVAQHVLVAGPDRSAERSRRGSWRPRRRVCLLALTYIGFNAAAWALFSRASDFWQFWLAPALLVWYLFACGRYDESSAPPGRPAR
jgi:hypothetical protein